MAGTCNDCGAPTWGRYRICPDCRKARKRKSPHAASNEPYICNDCGYGWKSKKTFGSPSICPRCKSKNIIAYRNTDQYKQEQKRKRIAGLVIFGVSILVILFMIFSSTPETPISKINQTSSESTKIQLTPEEELTNFCVSQFSNAGIFDLKKTDYQNDFSSASDWIRNNYENSALTQEQKEHNINYIIENQLPKQGYPIVITSGSKKDGQVTSQGFYYCNENGVI